MENLNNAMNNTTTNTAAKITTEEALEIIKENYIKLDHFEQDYHRFIERVNKEVGDQWNREEFLLIDPHGFGDDITGEVWKDLVFVYNDENDTIPALYVGLYWIHVLAYPENLLDDDEEEFEFSVETLNGIADWRDGGIDNIIANTMYDLNEKLDNYIRTIDEYKETKRSLEHDLYRYNDAIEALSMIDSDAADDYELDFDNDYFEVEDGYYGAKEITERYDDMSSFYFDSDEGNDFCGWEIQREFEDAVEETVGDIIAQILSNIDESTLGEDEKRNLVDIKGVQCFCDELRFLDRWDNLLFKYDCLEQKVVD